MAYNEQERSSAFRQALLQMTDLLEANPKLRVPRSLSGYVFFRGDESNLETLKTVADALGTFKKVEGYNDFVGLRKHFGARLYITYYFDRRYVSNRRKVGTREYERIAYTSSSEGNIVTVYEDVFKWEDPPFLDNGQNNE